MNDFFRENIWASYVVAAIVVIAAAFFIFDSMRKNLDNLAQRNPDLDFFGNIFGRGILGRMVPFAVFILFILLSWFLTKLYSS